MGTILGACRLIVGAVLVGGGVLILLLQLSSFTPGLAILGILCLSLGAVVCDIRGIRRYVPGFRGGLTRRILATAGYAFAALMIAGSITSSPTSPGTASASVPRPTRAAIQATPTPSRADAEAIDPRRLVAGPNDYKGRRVVVEGKANNVTQNQTYTWMQLYAQVPGRDLTESVVVEIRPRDTSIVKSECYRVYGTVAGTQQTKLVLTGASSEAVQIDAYSWESYAPGKYGSCASNP